MSGGPQDKLRCLPWASLASWGPTAWAATDEKLLEIQSNIPNYPPDQSDTSIALLPYIPYASCSHLVGDEFHRACKHAGPTSSLTSAAQTRTGNNISNDTQHEDPIEYLFKLPNRKRGHTAQPYFFTA